MSFRNKLWSVFAAAGLSLGAVSPAHAVFVLAFDLDGNPLAGAPQVQIFDNAAGDLNPAVGAITFSGPVAGSGFDVNVSTAISKPLIGPAELELNSVNVSSSGAGKITIIASDTNYVFPGGPGVYNLVSNIGGTVNPTGGSLSNLSGLQGVDELNDLYGMFFFDAAVTFVSHGPFGPGAFSDTKAVSFFAGDTTDFPFFSLTEAVTITHTSSGVSAFSIHSSVAEPATLALLALGLIGLGGFARRRAA